MGEIYDHGLGASVSAEMEGVDKVGWGCLRLSIVGVVSLY